MKSAIALACVTLLAAQSACTPSPIASAQPPVQRERMSYLMQTANVPVTCTAGTDCSQKWTRAFEWVRKNTVYSIQSHTDSEIITNGPLEPTTDSAFSITKTPEGSSGFAIHFSSTCGKTVPCSPTTLELGAKFNNYVMYGIGG